MVEEFMTDIGTICSRGVYIGRPGDALAHAARQMLASHVGALVVVDPESEGLRPLGMLTDRDIVCGQLGSARDLFCLNVEDVMSSDVLTLAETCGIAEALGRMSERSVRRAPVVDHNGNLVGIVTLDDLLPALAKDLDALAQLVSSQPRHEKRSGADR
jgi:CBS domain-containing protein